MKKIYYFIMRCLILIFLYGTIYFIIETIFKGHITNYRMAILGGIMGLLIGLINDAFSFDTDLLLQGMIGSICVTLAEAILGYQWNIIDKLAIWNYSSLRFSAINGQVCLEFSLFAWFPLSIICIIIDDSINYYWFKGKICPYYKIFSKEIFRMPLRRD